MPTTEVLKGTGQALQLTAADAVWLATAMMHRESPEGLEAEFRPDEIVDRVLRERLTAAQQNTIYQHVIQHCVANRPPNQAKLRMLWETPSGKRRLLQAGDVANPERAHGRTEPATTSLPPGLRELVSWFHETQETTKGKRSRFDALLSLIGSGKKIWGDETADDYVRRLREGWE